MKVTRKKLIRWGLIAYLSVIIGPPSVACALLVVDAFHITKDEKWEAQSEGPYRPEKVIARETRRGRIRQYRVGLHDRVPGQRRFRLVPGHCRPDHRTHAEPPRRHMGHATPGGRRPRRELIEPPLIIDEPPTPPPPPPRRRS